MTTSFDRYGFCIGVAGPSDDNAVGSLLNDNAIPGWIGLSYQTKPGRHSSLWDRVQSATVLGRRLCDGRPGGIATRSILPGFFEGRPAEIGWLGQLRIDREFRNRVRLLRAGFDAVNQLLHDPTRTPWYLASIIAGNTVARRILEAKLPGFPVFEPLFDFQTLAISTSGRARKTDLRPARADEMDEVAAFLDAENRSRDFAPRLDSSLTRPGDGTGFVGLNASNILIHERDGTIDGVAAIWEQRPFRSLVVTGYHEPLRMLRPLANLVAPLFGQPHLPAPGQALRQVYLSLATVRNDDEPVWLDLVSAGRTVAHAMGADLLVMGFAAGDPAAAIVARRFSHRRYDSTVFRVYWPEDRGIVPRHSPSRPKVEIGLL